MDPRADLLILETAKRLLHEHGYDRLTMDGVAREAGVARTTVYRRYRDKADLVSAAIQTLREPVKGAGSGDTRRDLIAHVLPSRQIVTATIREGIARGEVRADVDVERVLDLLLGAFFAAVFAQGRPGEEWPGLIVDAIWPALRAGEAPS